MQNNISSAKYELVQIPRLEWLRRKIKTCNKKLKHGRNLAHRIPITNLYTWNVFISTVSSEMNYLHSTSRYLLVKFCPSKKNAFGEVHHNLIQTVQDYQHIPDHIKLLIKSLYTDSIITPDFRTPFIIIGHVFWKVPSIWFFIQATQSTPLVPLCRRCCCNQLSRIRKSISH